MIIYEYLYMYKIDLPWSAALKNLYLLRASKAWQPLLSNHYVKNTNEISWDELLNSDQKLSIEVMQSNH